MFSLKDKKYSQFLFCTHKYFKTSNVVTPVIGKFEFQSPYYIHYLTNILRKHMPLLDPLKYGVNINANVDIPLNKQTEISNRFYTGPFFLVCLCVGGSLVFFFSQN